MSDSRQSAPVPPTEGEDRAVRPAAQAGEGGQEQAGIPETASSQGILGIDGTSDQRSEAPTQEQDEEDDPTGWDDLEELGRRADAGEPPFGSGNATGGQNPAPPGTGFTFPARGQLTSFPPRPPHTIRSHGRGRHALSWTPQEDAEVLRIGALPNLTRQQRANMFNALFPANPPRSPEAVRAREVILRTAAAGSGTGPGPAPPGSGSFGLHLRHHLRLLRNLVVVEMMVKQTQGC
ncbi:uncharacterized protein LTR77_000597 [Saxophila tyrrhenica]|uniref:Uncharacterized protein n=1 Tax=Saxophila tyrrhenica TaxID=1690608 RepID=A0AAV9PQE0_9PEZI|nr:hypothetical protein LTR77_000597 [Saxophila tyrrhenica]